MNIRFGFVFVFLFASNAFGLVTSDVIKCSQGSASARRELHDQSLFLASGIDIYKISPDSAWGSLPKSIFKDPSRQSFCFKKSSSEDLTEIGELTKKKKSEMKPADLRSCAAHQIGASRIDKRELNTLLVGAIKSYSADMKALTDGGQSFSSEDKSTAARLLKGFDLCQDLELTAFDPDAADSLQTARDASAALAKKFGIRYDAYGVAKQKYRSGKSRSAN